MSEVRRVDLVVVGGGLTGLALAAAVARAGRPVLVVEPTAFDPSVRPDFDGRTTAVAAGSRHFLEAIGLWDRVADAAEPILDIEVAESDGPPAVHYDHREVGDEPLGHIVENTRLRHGLERLALTLPSLELRRPTRLAALERDGQACHVQLSDGSRWRAPLVAACDGKESPLREQLGIRTQRWRYQQTGLVATFAHERPHRGIAHERFFPDGPFAILPMTGQRVSLVWAAEDRLARELRALDDLAFLGEVAERIGDRLGDLELVGPRWSYPLELVWADRYTEGRVALVGDTARAIHPIAGQGWNLALRDVAALAEIVVERTAAGLDPGTDEALATYAAWRRFDGLALVAITDGLARLFRIDAWPVRLARETGLAIVERTPPLKRFFMRHAMGLVGDLPRSMRDRSA